MALTLFFQFMRKHWMSIAVVLMVIGAVSYVSHLRSTISDQEQQISQAKFENGVLKDNNTKLEASLAASNAAIAKVATGATQTKKDFANLNANVAVRTSELERRMLEVLREKTPQTCDESIKYLIDAAKEYNHVPK